MRIHRFLLVIISLTFLVACSEETKYKVLSFFFDGVPNPFKKVKLEKVITVDSSKIKRRQLIVKQSELKMFFHEPFRQRLCGDCHNLKKGNELLSQPPALCFKCHDNFLSEVQFKHGPASAGYCTECHHPHMDKNKFMLKRKGQKLCLYCHQMNDIIKNEVHLEIEDTDCWECHDPHGSNEEFFL